MYIVDYVRGEVVNMDNVMSIYKDDIHVMAMTKARDICLGAYETKERAAEVFAKMLAEAFPPNTFIADKVEIDEDELKNAIDMSKPLMVITKGDAKIERYDVGVYYMPEE